MRVSKGRMQKDRRPRKKKIEKPIDKTGKGITRLTALC